MGQLLIRRILQGALVVSAVSVVVFIVTRMVGDPVGVMLPLDATLEQRASFEKALGLDKPLWKQFVEFMGNALRLDFGESLWQRRSAFDIVVEHLPSTLILVSASLFIAVLVAVPMGALGALRPGSLSDRLSVTLSMLGLSLPSFWLGLMLILIFGVRLQWLPTSGAGGIRHLILPAVTLAVPIAGRLVMVVRVTMIEEFNRPWIKTARAKGLSTGRIVTIHALRNGAVPIVTMIGWETIRALSGYAVVVEAVFAWPGVGYLAYQTVLRQDLILLQAIVLVIAVMVVAANLILDIIYKALDPRIKIE